MTFRREAPKREQPSAGVTVKITNEVPVSGRGLTKGFSLSKEEAYTTVLIIGIRKEAQSQVLHLSRNKRYTLTPEQLKWDNFKLTYKYSFAILPLVNSKQH